MHVIKDDTPTLRPIARLASGRRCSYDKLGTSYFGAPRHAPQAHPRTVSVQIEIPFPRSPELAHGASARSDGATPRVGDAVLVPLRQRSRCTRESPTAVL